MGIKFDSYRGIFGPKLALSTLMWYYVLETFSLVHVVQKPVWIHNRILSIYDHVFYRFF